MALAVGDTNRPSFVSPAAKATGHPCGEKSSRTVKESTVCSAEEMTGCKPVPQMHIERHVFGSITGYATLARSAGLTAGERQELESLSFGTPYDPSYQASLLKKAAVWSRPLGSGKRAVSRVLPGRPDDAGRPTLLFVTAVVSAADWNLTLQGDVRPLLRRAELWKWDDRLKTGPTAELAAMDLEGLDPEPLRLSRDSAQRVLGLVSLVELAWATRQPAVVRAEHYSLNEVALVERLLPTGVRRDYSAVYRGLNPDLAASLNCLAEGVPADTSNPVRRLDAAKSPYALRLAGEGLAEGRTPEVLLVGYDHFGQPQIDMSRRGDRSGAGPTEGREDHAVNVYAEHGPAGTSRSKAVQLSPALLAALLLVVLLIGGVIGWSVHAASRQPLPPAPAAPPWEELLSEAIGLPTEVSGEQLTTIASLQTSLTEQPFVGTPEAEELTQALSELRQTVRLTREAETAIAKINPDKRSSIRLAQRALDALAARAPQPADALRDWFETRQRPSEDTLEIVSERLRNEVTAQLEEMETQTRRIDTRTLKRATQLRASLNLFESVTMDRRLHWVGSRLSRLDRMIGGWEAELERLAQRMHQDARQDESDEVANLGRLGESLAVLSTTLDESGTIFEDRRLIGEALRQVASDGQADMGNIFARPIDKLADWILALGVVSAPELIEDIKLTAKECREPAKTIKKVAQSLSEATPRGEYLDAVDDILKTAPTFADKFFLLEELIKKLESKPRGRNDSSP